jgi:exosortase D (VPLPA-CTERM-specific)
MNHSDVTHERNSFLQIRFFDWMQGISYAVLIILLYFGTLSHLVTNDWKREDYSSSALIPLVVLYILWEKRRQISAVPAKSSWIGCVPLFAGIALYWLGELAGEFFTLYISLWLVTVGLCWLHLGWEKLKTISFPLSFSLIMFPLPNFANIQLSLKLKLLSSQLGVGILQLCGMSTFREGNVIDVGFTRLQVVDACSGIRYLMPLLAMAILLAYYYKGAFWKRLLVVLSALPISVVTNGMRIASVGLLYPLFGAQVAEGFFHDFSGWFIFMASLGILLGEIWLLRRLLPDRPDERTVPAATVHDHEDDKPVVSSPQRRMSQFVVAVLFLGVNLAAAKGIDFREEIPLHKPLAEFPVTIGEWQGTSLPMEKMYRDSLKFNDYVIIDYRNPQGKEINFYTAYYASQTKGGSVHTPATCLPGSGWNFEESGLVSVPLHISGNPSAIDVSRAFMSKSGQRQLTYYWFPQRGRILTNLFQLKLYGFWDALTRRRTDGALVRIITPVYPVERVEDAEARVQSFIAQIKPALDLHLPGVTTR